MAHMHGSHVQASAAAGGCGTAGQVNVPRSNSLSFSGFSVEGRAQRSIHEVMGRMSPSHSKVIDTTLVQCACAH